MNKSHIAAALLAALPYLAPMQVSAGTTDVTPLPAVMTVGKGEMRLSPTTSLTVNAPAAEAQALKTYIADNWRSFSSKPSGKSGSVEFSIVSSLKGVTSPEGYTVSVSPKKTVVKATTSAGLFYGLQTLMQLADGSDTMPCVEITDSPRFKYRGVMIDISRHFRDKNFIKKQIDAMAALKMNNLHLHLTDAAGWRIEIKKYPRLTEWAAWRPQCTWKEWNDGGKSYGSPSGDCAFGGFLTQDDCREIVKYAADRHINVIPEIEMPSHSEELTAAYPELSCTHNPQGEPDVCIGNEKTFEMLQNILDEVIDIFPSNYIHIGGDEASKKNWPDCPLCQKRMKDENIKDVDGLQSYLITRMEKYINSKGRSLLGWDEIMEGGLAPNATVMSWRGVEGGINAAKSGHHAIMSPGGYCYLDSYQDAPATQPEAIGGYLPLERVYSYNPVPDSLASQIEPWVLGVQGNLWCEYIPTAQQAEYMLYPRTVAIAEIGWTPQERRSWDDFHRRALKVNDRMHADGYFTFDLRGETGNRPQSLRPEKHLAVGKPVTYNVPWWGSYNAAGNTTLTDGIRGGWSYGDGKWQGFLYRKGQRVDVTVDLEKVTDISYIGADFMQIVGPGVWFPEKVVISVSDNGTDFTTLKEIDHKQKETPGLSFKLFDWEGKTKARYVRYQATASNGCQFTDEIIIR